MAEYIEREALLSEIENDYKNVEKIKTPFAKIIVDGTVEKPYYSILWLDKENKGYNVGYSSYCLDYVFEWLEVVFEIVAADESPAADVAPVVLCRDCLRCEEERTAMGHVLYCRHWARNTVEDGYCHEGWRRMDGE